MYIQKTISKKLRIVLFTSCRSLTILEGSGSISQRYGSADPDPYQNFIDPQHCKILKQYGTDDTDKKSIAANK
jgi:hypothetical protein